MYRLLVWNVMVREPEADRILRGELMKAGKVKPVIDRQYGLSEVAEAIRKRLRASRTRLD
jgi:NADPH:quinone reductase-like Zn-dependent oxidoreductase